LADGTTVGLGTGVLVVGRSVDVPVAVAVGVPDVRGDVDIGGAMADISIRKRAKNPGNTNVMWQS
ncbi:MAG: hypothetical protein ACRDFS_05245, partial [Chloroflexota bacterium]